MPSSLPPNKAESGRFTTAPRRKLLFLGTARTRTYPLIAEGEVTIGRGEDCDIVIDDTSVATRHVTLRVGPTLTLINLASEATTLVGGRKLTGGESAALPLGTPFLLGNAALVVQVSSPSTRMHAMRSHAYFEARLEDECARTEHQGGVFAVARIVCEHRHVRVLEEMFAMVLRPMDVVAVYGPDEYEVLLLDTGPDRARYLLERVAADLGHHGVSIRTAVAGFPRDARTPESLLAAVNAPLHGGSHAPPREVVHGGSHARPTVPPSAPPTVPPTVPPPAPQEGFMERMTPLLERVGATSISVLLLGETGAGKEVLARAIHRMSPRAQKPLVSINCASFSESMLEAEIFGYERGAFTGAVQAKPGLFEIADGGTVLLDELGEMPITLQAKLLRVFEHRQVMRLGSVQARAIDVRFVSATNRDLEQEVERGGFRRDLFFRVNGIPIVVPPLRERACEIAALAQSFVAAASESAGLPSAPAISPAALDLLTQYTWPGNIRELRNVMERAVILSNGDAIGAVHLPVDKMVRSLPQSNAVPFEWPPTPSLSWSPSAMPASSSPSPAADGFAPDADQRARIIAALDRCAGNQTQAAKVLGVSRRTLINRIEQYDLPRPKRGTRDKG